MGAELRIQTRGSKDFRAALLTLEGVIARCPPVQRAVALIVAKSGSGINISPSS